MAPSRLSSTSLSSTAPLYIETRLTPTVTLDAVDIGHAMAARLTIALLDHILYMKGQVPFPVQSIVQMAQREATGQLSNSCATMRTAKRRAEFLQSHDDLTSHLHTTFVALSTALALDEAKQLSPMSSIPPTYPPAKVYVLLILGPSPSAAKARVLLELDGLRIEKFGEQETLRREEERARTGGTGEDSESDSGNESSVQYDSTDEEALEDTHSPSPLHRPWIPSSDFVCGPSTPPQWRTQSPTSSSRSSRPESAPSSSSECLSSEEEDSLTDFSHMNNLELRAILGSSEESLRAGERLLSRALIAAGEGLGFGDEISPTQAHIFIRAPRRLVHPTWVPRQSLGSSLDRHVRRFLDTESPPLRPSRVRKSVFGGVPTVGVRVTCRSARNEAQEGLGPNSSLESRERNVEDVADVEAEEGDDEEEESDERDDLIWWSWDGKLVGFTD